MSKKYYQFPKKEESYMQLRSTVFSFGPYLCVTFAEKKKYVLLTLIFEKHNVSHTAWKMSTCGVISGLYFPVFSPNTGKYEPEITPYLNNFHAVSIISIISKGAKAH